MPRPRPEDDPRQTYPAPAPPGARPYGVLRPARDASIAL